MIDLQTLLFVLGQRNMVALEGFPLGIQIGHRLVQRQHAHILEQRCQEYFFGQ